MWDGIRKAPLVNEFCEAKEKEENRDVLGNKTLTGTIQRYVVRFGHDFITSYSVASLPLTVRNKMKEAAANAEAAGKEINPDLPYVRNPDVMLSLRLLPAAQDSISMPLTCACSPRSVECPAHLNKRRHAYIEWAGKLRACLFTTWLLLDRDPSTKSRSTHLQERQTPSRRFSCQSNIYLMQTETKPNNVYVNTRLA